MINLHVGYDHKGNNVLTGWLLHRSQFIDYGMCTHQYDEWNRDIISGFDTADSITYDRLLDLYKGLDDER